MADFNQFEQQDSFRDGVLLSKLGQRVLKRVVEFYHPFSHFLIEGGIPREGGKEGMGGALLADGPLLDDVNPI